MGALHFVFRQLMVFGKDIDEVLHRRSLMFNKLLQADRKMKPSKCFMFQAEA